MLYKTLTFCFYNRLDAYLIFAANEQHSCKIDTSKFTETKYIIYVDGLF
jgi:hypothetical protein